MNRKEVDKIVAWVASWWPKYEETVEQCQSCKSLYDRGYCRQGGDGKWTCKGCEEAPLYL